MAPTLVPGEGILAHQAVSGVDHEGTDINGVDCDRIPSRGEGWISGSIPSTLTKANRVDDVIGDATHKTHNGKRDGSTDPSLPSNLAQMGVQVEAEDS